MTDKDLKEKIAQSKDLNLQLPAKFQTSKKLKGLATQQMDAALNLLRHPNKKSKELLQAAALSRKALTDQKDWANVKDTILDRKINRSVHGGVWNYKTHFDTVDAGQKASLKDTQKLGKRQMEYIKEVTGETKQNDPRLLAASNAGIMAMMGDLGTAFFDCDVNRKEGKYCEASDFAAKFFETTKEIFMEASAKGKTWRGGKAIAPLKKDERGMAVLYPHADYEKLDNLLLKPEVKDSKLYMDGNLAWEASKKTAAQINAISKNKQKDFMIMLKFRSGLLQEQANKGWLLRASWPWQTIPENYFKCEEPWAGHYSGSIVEVIWSMDLFSAKVKKEALVEAQKSFGDVTKKTVKKKDKDCKEENQIEYEKGTDKPDAEKKNFDNEERRCKAALSAAFLIGIGYHSAIEVKPTVWMYLGKPMPKIMSNKTGVENCDSTATKDMVKLMTDCTDLEAQKKFDATKKLR